MIEGRGTWHPPPSEAKGVGFGEDSFKHHFGVLHKDLLDFGVVIDLIKLAVPEDRLSVAEDTVGHGAKLVVK